MRLNGDMSALEHYLAQPRMVSGPGRLPNIVPNSDLEGKRIFYSEWTHTEDKALFKDINSNDF